MNNKHLTNSNSNDGNDNDGNYNHCDKDNNVQITRYLRY